MQKILHSLPHNPRPNIIKNQRYSMITIVPVVLFNQFSQASNLLFLFIGLIQCFPIYVVVSPLSSFVPLILVSLINIFKESVDDYRRYLRDCEFNSQPYECVDFGETIVIEYNEEKKNKWIDIILNLFWIVIKGCVLFWLYFKKIVEYLLRLIELGRSGNTLEINNTISEGDNRTDCESEAHNTIKQDNYIEKSGLNTISEDRKIKNITRSSSKTSDVKEIKRQIRIYKKACGNIRELEIIKLYKNQRVPADVIILQSDTEQVFIRTDQLDGETDWKTRVAVPLTSNLSLSEMKNIKINVEKPNMDIHSFTGVLKLGTKSIELTVENTMWSGTVLASGTVYAMPIYIGDETRAMMNTAKPKIKVGLIERELSKYMVILGSLTFIVSLIFSFSRGEIGRNFDVPLFGFFIIFSNLIPISLRTSVDMARYFHGKHITADGIKVKNSNLPEELGRIKYLLSDKTGTLTNNFMVMKKIHLGTDCYDKNSFSVIKNILSTSRGRRVRELIEGLAVCHNVMPVYDLDEDNGVDFKKNELVTQDGKKPDILLNHRLRSINKGLEMISKEATELKIKKNSIDEAKYKIHSKTTYKGSSPDEIAILKFTESLGMRLIERSNSNMKIETKEGVKNYKILNLVPYTSELKRMGIIVEFEGVKIFYLKGADDVMRNFVMAEWLDEEVDNFARDGLRTLVIAKKNLNEEDYELFLKNGQVAIEKGMKLIGLTGVEDTLQDDVRMALECLKNADIKIWMLTGDKIETATSIAISSRLFDKNKEYLTVRMGKDKKKQYDEFECVSNNGNKLVKNVSSVADTKNVFFKHDFPNDITIYNDIEFNRKLVEHMDEYDGLIIDGDSISYFIETMPSLFINKIRNYSIVACRCTPTQKSLMVKHLGEVTGKRIAAIGDGGNDVSMITKAHVGIGIEGREGNAAALASDFTLTKFAEVLPLILFHGRRSYKGTARLCNLIIHRGSVLFVIQSMICYIFHYSVISIYDGYLMMGYATIYTFIPIICTVFSSDIPLSKAIEFPELYKELSTNNYFDLTTISAYFFIAYWQGTLITLIDLEFCDNDMAIFITTSFTSLIVNELLMIAMTSKMDRYLLIGIGLSFAMYASTFFIFPDVLVVPQNWFYLVLKMLGGNILGIVLIIMYNFYRSKIKPAPYMKV